MLAFGKKVALVTGANKGIGFEIARQLGNAGCAVVIGARNLILGEQAANALRGEKIDVRVVELDLERFETIAAAAKSIDDEFQRLDVLVNNAGIADQADGPPSKAGIDAIDKVMKINFVGAVSVTQAMLPLIRKSAAGRVVNMSSGLGSLTLHGDPDWEFASVKRLGYCASKAALNMFTVQLAYELRNTNIKVNSADPGFTATDLNQHRGHQTVQEGAAEAVRLAQLPDDGPTGGFFQTRGINPW
jgi:NAD(P)-dependent dehydrogenase (short-subunit alcohol dehydrogenase family)